MEHETKAKWICLDIETIATTNPLIRADVEREAREKRPAQNTLKEKKILWDTHEAIEERVQEALDRTAVDPLWAEPICVCWSVGRVNERVVECSRMIEQGQSVASRKLALSLVADAWDEDAGPETVWIGHNIAGFDLPVLLNTWRRDDTKPPAHFPQYVNGRWRGRVWDTMLRSPVKNGLGLISLDDLYRAYIEEPPGVDWDGSPMDGSRVAAAYAAGEYQLITEYCMCDVRCAREIYRAQTADETWGTYDQHDEVAEQIREIEASSEPESRRAIQMVRVLDRAGLIPR